MFARSGAAEQGTAARAAQIESSLVVKQFLGLLSMWIGCCGALVAESLS